MSNLSKFKLPILKKLLRNYEAALVREAEVLTEPTKLQLENKITDIKDEIESRKS